MGIIEIKQAHEADIPIIERILLDTVNWLNEINQPLWDAEEVSWEKLSGNPKKSAYYVSGNYKADDFYIAYIDEKPSGCMVLIDYDPSFWPDIKKGEALFIHKLAVTKEAKKSGVSDELMNYFKAQGIKRKIKTLCLDTDANRPKTRAFYERHGFSLLNVKEMGQYNVAFYIHSLKRT